MTAPDEAALIAGKLTKAQRVAILTVRASNQPNRSKLIAMKLALTAGGMRGIYLTPLGYRVRQILEQEASGHE